MSETAGMPTLAPVTNMHVIEDLAPSPEEESFDPTIMVTVFCAVVCLWCCAVCLTTKGCRDCSYNDDAAYTGGVWANLSREDRDRLLALELQQQEDASRTPEDLEQARQRWERQAVARSTYLETMLPVGTAELVAVVDSTIILKTAGTEETQNTNSAGATADDDDDDEKWRCAICLGQTTNHRTKRVVSSTSGLCHHQFHRRCVAGWLLQKTECPVCRQCFLKEDHNPPKDRHVHVPLAFGAAANGSSLETMPLSGGNEEEEDSEEENEDGGAEGEGLEQTIEEDTNQESQQQVVPQRLGNNEKEEEIEAPLMDDIKTPNQQQQEQQRACDNSV